jgi:hypothetical protein
LDWITVNFTHQAESSNVSQDPIFEFPPARSVPGPWREIVIDASPAAINAYWRTDDDTLARAIHRPAGAADKADALFRRQLDPAGVGRGPLVPAWSCRGPVGVYVVNAGIAFRNVSLQPNPADSIP